MKKEILYILLSLLLLTPTLVAATLDETPATEKEWGYRPAQGMISPVNPPAFCWRPQKELVRWELECASDSNFDDVVYSIC